MSKLVTIATFDHPVAAETLKAELEKEGFRVFLADTAVVGSISVLSDILGGIKVQVPKVEAKMAASIVAKHDQFREIMNLKKAAQPDVSFECEECGKPLVFPGARRGGVESCPHCHETIDVPE